MGLGKTIQVLSLLLLLQRHRARKPHLLVVPASLLGNWRAEAERFAPGLRLLIVHPSAMSAAEIADAPANALDEVDVVLTTYGTATRVPWLASLAWGLVVLDEAQAIKNPDAQQTRAVKALKSDTRLALTGTPVENRLSDLWSIFDFVCPGLLGSSRAFRDFTKRLDAEGGHGYAPLRSLVRPYILRRLKSDRSILPDLPDKTELFAYCGLTRVQATLYAKAVKELEGTIDSVEGIQRRGTVLAYLLRFKQLCNHPSQWLGDGAYRPEDSGKLARLRELCEPIAARQEKALVFTQFREMTAPLADFLAGIFGRPGLVLHGGTPVGRRAGLVKEFQQEDGPPFFVLSLKAGGTGLNLTEASHVIHFDRWWNPAVEAQATDRAYRIGQKKNVLVHKLVCRGTIEERIDALVEAKRGLSAEILGGAGGGEAWLTELRSDELIRLVSLDLRSALEEG
jgi:non-specific serine/threonine protein kinase